MAKKKESKLEKIVKTRLIISGDVEVLKTVQAVLITHINPDDVEIKEEY